MGSAGMDVVEIMRSYVGRMLRDVKGMKVLLLDAETTDMVACAYSQSEVLEQEVYLVQRLDDDSKEPMPHLKVGMKQGCGRTNQHASEWTPPLTLFLCPSIRRSASCAPLAKT